MSDNLEELEKKLYGEKFSDEEKKREALQEPRPSEIGEVEIKKYWEKEESRRAADVSLSDLLRPVGERLGVLSRFLFRRASWVLAAVFVVIIAASGFLIYQYFFTAKEIGLSLEMPAEVLIGAPFDVKVNYSNASGNVLKRVKLSLALPDGAVFLGRLPGQTVEARTLGDVGIGTASSETFTVIVLKDPRSVKRFSTSLLYEPVLGTKFERRVEEELAVAEAAVALDFIVPEKVLSGEEFELEVSYKNVSGVPLSDLELSLVYPPTFSFIKATSDPAEGNNVWKLGDLKANSEGKVGIKGALSGPEQSFFNFEATLRASFLGQSYAIGRRTASLAIAPSPLALSIFLNGESGYVARPGETLRYSLVFKNNTTVGLKDVVIKARLVGEMFDFISLREELFFNSLTNILTWNASNFPSLQLVPPGGGGMINFEINAKDRYPIRRLSDRNFVLRVEAAIDSPTVPYFVAAERVSTAVSFESRVIGAVKADALGFYRDAASGILNAGPFPPKLNTPTNYTIHWRLTNFSTDVRDIEVRASLQSGVSFTGRVKSNVASEPVYNARTQEVIWTIDRLAATKGITSEPAEAVFQVEATPAVNQLGGYQPLIGETRLKAIDEFTGFELSDVDVGISTSLPDDSTVGAGGGKVVN